MDVSVELRKDRFFHRKCCAYCKSTESLDLDAIQPYMWVKESVWGLSDYELDRLFVSEIQILCDTCMRRKKQMWKSFLKERPPWLLPYLEKYEHNNHFGRSV